MYTLILLWMTHTLLSIVALQISLCFKVILFDTDVRACETGDFTSHANMTIAWKC